MEQQKKRWEREIAVCLAANEAYAPYCRVTINSMLKHRNPGCNYDIFILTKDMKEASKEKILELSDFDAGVSIRFVDMQELEASLKSEVGAYYSIETNYRLWLLAEAFSDFEKVIYLDSDLVVLGDISRLYDEEMHGKALAAVKDYSLERNQLKCVPVFVGEEPYSIRNYCTQVLGLESEENYFNAGVLLFDLRCCRRKKITWEKALGVLKRENYYYNDQDVLNILFADDCCLLETKWNYFNMYQLYKDAYEPAVRKMAEKIEHDKKWIVHFVSGVKPWNDRSVPLAELYLREIHA